MSDNVLKWLNAAAAVLMIIWFYGEIRRRADRSGLRPVASFPPINA